MTSLNKVEKGELNKFKVIVESNYPITSIYSNSDARYIKDRENALNDLGLKGRKITQLGYDDKMTFIFKMLINNGGYTVQRIFELMDKSNNAFRARLAFQKVLQTMKSGSKKKTKRKKKSIKKKSKRSSKKKKKSSKKKSSKRKKKSKKKRRLI